MRPPSNRKVSALAPPNGLALAAASAAASLRPAAATASMIAGTSEEVSIEPPDTGPAGKSVSPSTTSTLSTSTPSSSAAINAMAV
jgi:hypothetical protein